MSTSTEGLRVSQAWEPAAAAVATLMRIAGWPGRVHRARRILRELSGLAEHELRDIGLTRLDVAAASALPLGADPSRVLRQRAEERRGRI